jgi:hypothetical protein
MYKVRLTQFMQHNPQGFVLQQQPYQPQTAAFSDISGGYGYNQPMPQQMPRELTQSAAETLSYFCILRDYI